MEIVFAARTSQVAVDKLVLMVLYYNMGALSCWKYCPRNRLGSGENDLSVDGGVVSGVGDGGVSSVGSGGGGGGGNSAGNGVVGDGGAGGVRNEVVGGNSDGGVGGNAGVGRGGVGGVGGVGGSAGDRGDGGVAVGGVGSNSVGGEDQIGSSSSAGVGRVGEGGVGGVQSGSGGSAGNRGDGGVGDVGVNSVQNSGGNRGSAGDKDGGVGSGGKGGYFWNQGPPSSGEDDEFYPGDFNFLNHSIQTQPARRDNAIDLDSICGTVVIKDKNAQSKRHASYPYQYHNYHNPSTNYDNGIRDRIYSYVRNIRNFLSKAPNGRNQVGSLQEQPRPSITKRQTTHEGDFPWHAALYHAKGIDLGYICGASLVSRYHVITVAHCVTKRRSNEPLNPANLVVYLGKYYIKRFSSPGIQDRQVAKILPHPLYNTQTYSNDIALVKFTAPADFTDYVRPVCLWQESPDLTSVLNKEGNVVGWGFDETGKVTEALAQAKLEIVSQETCILSFPDFYGRFTSNNTYCAGFSNDTTACNGDSGGGMVLPKSNSNGDNPVWQLRGLVSISLALQNQSKCDRSHYVVFTDTAKYLDWIKNSMK